MSDYKGKRIVFTAQGKVEILDFVQPRPKKGEVTVENVSSLVSAGTELATLYAYRMKPVTYPTNTGYISCVRVIEVGEGVENIKTGDMFCYSMGHLSYLTIPVSEALIPVPDNVKPEDAVFTQIAGISMRAVRQANIHLGDSVYVAGLGLIGQFAQIFARMEGGVAVLGADPSAYRREIAGKTGLRLTADPLSKNFGENLKSAVKNGLFRVSIDSTGTPNVINALPALTGDNGRVIVLGGVHQPVQVDFYTHIQKRNLRIIGAGSADPENWPYDSISNQKCILEMMKLGLLDVSPLRTHHAELKEAPSLYRMLHEEKDSGMGVVFKW